MKKSLLSVIVVGLFGFGGYIYVARGGPFRRQAPAPSVPQATAGAAVPAASAIQPAAVPAASAAPASAAPAPAALAAETTSTNLALFDMGGHVDHVTNGFGPGRLGTLLN